MKAHFGRGNEPAAATEAGWRRRLGVQFAAELVSKPNYREFRYVGVDDGGRELVRGDRSEPGVPADIVPDDELQGKGDREIFSQTIRLPAGEVYVSPVELSIEPPRIPVLRVATPVHSPDGRPFGIVIINVDMRPAFDRIRSGPTRGGRSYVVNDRGDYLVHPDPALEFGFEFGKPHHIQDDFPDFAQILASDDSAPRVMADRAGRRFGIGLASVRLADGPRVTLVQALPYADLTVATSAVRDSSLMAGFAAAFCALVLAVIVARSLTRPLVQLTRVVQAF